MVMKINTVSKQYVLFDEIRFKLTIKSGLPIAINFLQPSEYLTTVVRRKLCYGGLFTSLVRSVFLSIIGFGKHSEKDLITFFKRVL